LSRLNNWSIHRKMSAVALGVSGTSLIFACLCFISYDYFSFRTAFARRVEALAQIIGTQSTAALEFDDPKTAQEVLSSLAAEGHIRTARLLTADSRPIATYVAEGAVDTSPAPGLGGEGVRFQDGNLVVVRPIRLHDRVIGSVYLLSDLRDAKRRLRLNVAIGAGVLVVCLLVARLLTSRLGRIITGPILHLASTVRAVTNRKDYSVRAPGGGQDELGVLIDGFNGMLSKIEERDRELLDARKKLERRVEARTADLVRLNDSLRQEVEVRVRAEESLREGEERYRSLVESLPDAILIEENGRFSYANVAAGTLFGADHPEDLVGRSVEESIHPESHAQMRTLRDAVLRDGKSPPMDEHRFVRLDGSFWDGEITALPFAFRDRRTVQYVIRDITKRKELDRMKRDFISTVSHELRTPLTSIRGSLKLIATGVTGPLGPKTAAMVGIANDSCDRLVHLVNDILDIEKIESGRMEFDLRPLPMVPLLEKAVEANRPYAQSFSVSLRTEGGKIGYVVLADADRLMQVLTNLLSNAAKFSPRDSTVILRMTDLADRIRISVIDSGPGIPEEFRSRIFQKFAQADSSDARSKQGTGLGLSITKAIVERLGGQISFETSSGGTAFHVDLPRFSPPAPVTTAPRTGRAAVLVCEDDPKFASVLRLTLEHEGLDVDVATSAAEALIRLEEREYDGVTLDLALPDRDGISLLREMRTKPKTRELPVIVLSAYLDTARQMAADEGIDLVDWLEKPMDEEQLRNALALAIRRRIIRRGSSL
jgi:PAS domain S-box-containing protein